MSKPWEIDKISFEDLKVLDPQDVVARTGCKWDASTSQYHLNVWGYEYGVDVNKCQIFPITDGYKTYQDFLYLFIVFYLMKGKNTPPTGKWISEKDIPGGEGFFRGPHTLPTDVITNRVGDDISKFQALCKKMNGTPIDMADAAFSFPITPSIPVAVLYWQGDDDFPCESKLLFDETIKEQVPIDIVFSLAVEVCHAFSWV